MEPIFNHLDYIDMSRRFKRTPEMQVVHRWHQFHLMVWGGFFV